MEEKRNIFIILSFSISRKVEKATEMQKKKKNQNKTVQRVEKVL